MDTKDILRWTVFIGGIPIWWPYLRTLWKDFNSALSEDGGLFGAPPVGRDLERVRAQKALEPDPLVSEPWVRAGEQRAPRMGGAPRATKSRSQPETKGGFRSAKAPAPERRSGFRR